jgi:hypothetical protein
MNRKLLNASQYILHSMTIQPSVDLHLVLKQKNIIDFILHKENGESEPTMRNLAQPVPYVGSVTVRTTSDKSGLSSGASVLYSVCDRPRLLLSIYFTFHFTFTTLPFDAI